MSNIRPGSRRTVEVIVPLYYCSTKLYFTIQKCFKELAEVRGPKHITVVDDASPMDHPFMTTMRNDRNQGFTKTVNRGLRASKGGVLVVMNDDITLTQECFDRFSHLSGLEIASPMDTASSDDDRFGACWGMTREVYDLLGPLDETFRNFFSDTDYYSRAKAAGVKITKWRDITLEHPESSTYKLLNKKELLEEDRKRYEGV